MLKSMIVDEQTLKKVRDLGALGHTPSQIASLLDIPVRDKAAFLDELSRPETLMYAAYLKGKTIIEYNTNVELAHAAEKGDVEAIKLLSERKLKQKEAELLTELFGL